MHTIVSGDGVGVFRKMIKYSNSVVLQSNAFLCLPIVCYGILLRRMYSHIRLPALFVAHHRVCAPHRYTVAAICGRRRERDNHNKRELTMRMYNKCGKKRFFLHARCTLYCRLNWMCWACVRAFLLSLSSTIPRISLLLFFFCLTPLSLAAAACALFCLFSFVPLLFFRHVGWANACVYVCVCTRERTYLIITLNRILPGSSRFNYIQKFLLFHIHWFLIVALNVFYIATVPDRKLLRIIFASRLSDMSSACVLFLWRRHRQQQQRY